MLVFIYVSDSPLLAAASRAEEEPQARAIAIMARDTIGNSTHISRIDVGFVKRRGFTDSDEERFSFTPADLAATGH
jgi:hypothetical protein